MTELVVDNLSFRYGGEAPTLDRITFTVTPGERVAIVGPSGAGKSTLLLHLNGLLPNPPHAKADDATVYVRGRAVWKSNLAEVRQCVGMLFQNPDDQLFCPTVQEDVAFGPLQLGLSDEDVVRRVQTSLTRVGLDGFGERSTLQLSVGEKKRAALAGVFACQPSILALDEPFGNLDPRARSRLTDILGSFEGTLILASHDLNIVFNLCDRVIVLDEGTIRADGPPDKVLADPKLMDDHGLEVPVCLRLAKDAANTEPTVDDGPPGRSEATSSE